MRLDQSGIPHLSRDAIEMRAERVIAYYDKTVLESPQLTPINKFLARLVSDGHVHFEVCTLGREENGREVLGAFAFSPPTIRIDSSIVDTKRYEFVLAHELGHFVLHRRLRIRRDDYSGNILKDTERDFATFRKKLITPRDWIEWQANQFAASLLLPRATVRKAVARAQLRMGIGRNHGKIIVTASRSSIRDLRTVLGELRRVYNVHKTAIEYRLADLGILKDLRDGGMTHISELLMSSA